MKKIINITRIWIIPSVYLLVLFTVMFPSTTRALTSAAAAVAGDISVMIDGVILEFDVPPINVNGRILVPLRAIFEKMGASIEYDGATKTVTAKKGSSIVKLAIGDSLAAINGKAVTLDEPGVIVDGRTLAPLRFVAEAFGRSVEWDDINKTVNIILRKII